jgi:DNA-binding transcriptional regulator YbjK
MMVECLDVVYRTVLWYHSANKVVDVVVVMFTDRQAEFTGEQAEQYKSFKSLVELVKNGRITSKASQDIEGRIASFKEVGGDLNMQGEDGLTLLMHAAEKGDLEVVQFLIKNNANIDAQDENGKTALFHAVETQKFDAVQFLLHNKANINARDEFGKTTLAVTVGYKDSFEDRAEKRERIAMIQLLVLAGADLDKENANGAWCLADQAIKQAMQNPLQGFVERQGAIVEEESRTVKPRYFGVLTRELKLIMRESKDAFATIRSQEGVTTEEALKYFTQKKDEVIEGKLAKLEEKNGSVLKEALQELETRNKQVLEKALLGIAEGNKQALKEQLEAFAKKSEQALKERLEAIAEENKKKLKEQLEAIAEKHEQALKEQLEIIAQKIEATQESMEGSGTPVDPTPDTSNKGRVVVAGSEEVGKKKYYSRGAAALCLASTSIFAGGAYLLTGAPLLALAGAAVGLVFALAASLVLKETITDFAYEVAKKVSGPAQDGIGNGVVVS